MFFLFLYIIKDMFIIYIFLICFLFFYFCNKYIVHYEHYNNYLQIKFLDKKELYDILVKDEDRYYNSFFKNDYKTRNINKIEDYYNIINNSVDDFNEKEMNKIKECIDVADNFFKKINKEWFDGNKVNKIKWKIGKVKDKLYENGLPHTRNDIIIISKEDINNYNNQKLIKTLIHEKVHIYQKIYPEDCNIFINKHNFSRYKLREEKDNIRANPDMDKWIYKDMNGNIYKASYNNNPSNIEDIKYEPFNSQSYEHPFEKMAIDIENIF